MQSINPEDLVPMDVFEDEYPIIVDIVYTQAEHPENVFKTALYRLNTKLWLHKDMARIVLRAASICFHQQGWKLRLKDGLRTVEAQAAMLETEIVKANPQWIAEGPKRLLSPPGRGGHPRGMAIDVTVQDEDANTVDMGTIFDYLTKDPDNNPAARNYNDFGENTDEILRNRKVLEDAFLKAGEEDGKEILPLPQEWWDFRFPYEYSRQFKPLSDHDLPEEMRMTI